MFGDLPPLYVDPNVLAAIGAKNGPMKSTGAAQKTSNIPVAHIFFGQFVDHDITLDLTSSFARLDRPEATTNFRTPTLDLDCIYGDGPEGSPFMYFHDQPKFNGAKLLTGADMPGATAFQTDDLLRSPHYRAIIGDPRNDENRIISQLQLGMIRFHNKVLDHLDAAGVDAGHLFEEARRVVTWHYQWVVVNDYLRALVGQPLLDDIFGNGRFIYRPEDCHFGEHYGADPYIPVEFSVAAYRFGHSMIPQRIQIQAGKPALEVFGPTLGEGFGALNDADAVVHWPQVLDLSDPTVDRADKLDVKMAKDLLNLPFVTNGEKSLATRNFLRGQAFRLPSGENIAEACERPDSEIDQVSSVAKALASAANPPASLEAGTPLWLYVLAEASAIGQEVSSGTFAQGEGLGPVGGRIVAETIIGLLELDNGSYLGSNRQWSPTNEEYPLGTVKDLLSLLTF
tara:strand:+ start:5955 stop:7316 length:1362 start_codon:yes stop_codon:yes gene_type:complete